MENLLFEKMMDWLLSKSYKRIKEMVTYLLELTLSLVVKLWRRLSKVIKRSGDLSE